MIALRAEGGQYGDYLLPCPPSHFYYNDDMNPTTQHDWHWVECTVAAVVRFLQTNTPRSYRNAGNHTDIDCERGLKIRIRSEGQSPPTYWLRVSSE